MGNHDIIHTFTCKCINNRVFVMNDWTLCHNMYGGNLNVNKFLSPYGFKHP